MSNLNYFIKLQIKHNKRTVELSIKMFRDEWWLREINVIFRKLIYLAYALYLLMPTKSSDETISSHTDSSCDKNEK